VAVEAERNTGYRGACNGFFAISACRNGAHRSTTILLLRSNYVSRA